MNAGKSFSRLHLITAALCTSGLFACSGSETSCGSTRQCGPIAPDSGLDDAASGGAANDGSGGATGTGGQSGAGGIGSSDSSTTCDPADPPSIATCRVSDAYAVFVAPTGSDDELGTKTSPVKTIARAIDLASANGKVVIVCAATYFEAVKVGTGIEIYGGFACPDAPSPWTYPASTPTTVAPVASTYALEVRDVSADVIIEDLDFAAHDVFTPGASSIAAFVVNSPRVTLRRVTLTAGAGADGADGVNAGFMFPTDDTRVGNDAVDTTGALRKDCTCDDGSTTMGGSGGDSTQGGADGSPDYDGAAGTAGVGGISGIACLSGGLGQNGASGPSAPDADGATVLGALTASGWTPAPGTDAANGQPGQGGGGGAGQSGGGGGSGGCGGCGGKGGPGGGGGGASIGLLAVDAPVALDHVEIGTANAGNGGAGAPGQTGQVQGGRGRGFSFGCDGGEGGRGGNGGAGGGGAGGVSAGIAFKGVAPLLSETTFAIGAAGEAGPGGVHGRNDGAPGAAGLVVELP